MAQRGMSALPSRADMLGAQHQCQLSARSRLAANPNSCRSISNFLEAERPRNPRSEVERRRNCRPEAERPRNPRPEVVRRRNCRPEAERPRNPRSEVERRRNCRPEADNGQLRAGRRMRTEAHNSHMLEGSTHRELDTHIAGNIAGNNVVGSPRSRSWRPECLYCLFLTLTGGLRWLALCPSKQHPQSPRY